MNNFRSLGVQRKDNKDDFEPSEEKSSWWPSYYRTCSLFGYLFLKSFWLGFALAWYYEQMLLNTYHSIIGLHKQ